MNRKEFYESLSDEVKEKIRACASEQEMLQVLEDAQIELSPELLDGVAGGTELDNGCTWLYCDKCGCN